MKLTSLSKLKTRFDVPGTAPKMADMLVYYCMNGAVFSDFLQRCRLRDPHRHTAFLIGGSVVVVYILLFSLAMFRLHLLQVPIDTLLDPSGDAHEYVSLAHTMLSTHRFALTPSGAPEFFRTPGYPALLAIIFSIVNPVAAASVVNIILTGISAALVYLIGVRIFSRTSGIIAALLFAADPALIISSIMSMTEPLFVTLFLTTFLLVTASTPTTMKRAILIGLLISAFILTRPIGLYLGPMFLIYMVLKDIHLRSNKAIRASFVALVCSMLIIVPWMIRNEDLSGHFSLSTVSTNNMLFTNIAGFAFWSGAENEFTRDVWSLPTGDMYQLRSFAFVPQENAIIQKYFDRQIPLYISFHLIKSGEFFISSSVSNIDMPFYDLRIAGNTVLGHSFDLLSLCDTVNRAFWMLVSFCAALSAIFFCARRSPYRAVIIFCVIVVIAIALLTGPAGTDARYRIPAEPFILLLACEGIRRFSVWAYTQRDLDIHSLIASPRYNR